jgi:hypothetical protein
MKKVLSLAILLSCAGCSLLGNKNDSPSEINSSGLDAATSAVEFRQRFIGGHEIFKTCDGFPALAVSPEGKYYLANTVYLGNSLGDWSSVDIGRSTLHNDSYIQISLRNNIPIIAKSSSPFDANGVPSLAATTKYCAIFIEPSVAYSLFSQWSGSNYDQTAWAAGQDLINDQAAINQPILASWSYVRNPDPDIDTLLSKDMNLSAGMRSVNGYFSTKSGTHELMAECRDLFNTQPDTTCSAPLDIHL